MKILPNGYFSIEYTTEELARGIRPSRKMPRNNKFLTKCNGMVGAEGTLSKLDSLYLTEMFNDVLVEKNNFPFPQLFVLDSHIIVCNQTSILEVRESMLEVMLSSLASTGGRWTAVSAYNFIYMSNGSVSVVRDPETHIWAIDLTAPKGTVCNFNGQILVGNPR